MTSYCTLTFHHSDALRLWHKEEFSIHSGFLGWGRGWFFFNGHFALWSVTSSHVGSFTHIVSWIWFSRLLEFQHGCPTSEAEATPVRRLYLPPSFQPLDPNGLRSLHMAAELHKVTFAGCYWGKVLVKHRWLLRLWNRKGIFMRRTENIEPGIYYVSQKKCTKGTVASPSRW